MLQAAASAGSAGLGLGRDAGSAWWEQVWQEDILGFSGLLFGLKKVQEVSIVHLRNGVSLVEREVTGMWYVLMP